MKKFVLKAAVIAIAGYLGVVGYIHQYDKGQSEKLLAEGNYSAEQQQVAKILFDNGCNIVTPLMLIYLSMPTFR